VNLLVLPNPALEPTSTGLARDVLSFIIRLAAQAGAGGSALR
jgi:hypothetical protein